MLIKENKPQNFSVTFCKRFLMELSKIWIRCVRLFAHSELRCDQNTDIFLALSYTIYIVFMLLLAN